MLTSPLRRYRSSKIYCIIIFLGKILHEQLFFFLRMISTFVLYPKDVSSIISRCCELQAGWGFFKPAKGPHVWHSCSNHCHHLLLVKSKQIAAGCLCEIQFAKGFNDSVDDNVGFLYVKEVRIYSGTWCHLAAKLNDMTSVYMLGGYSNIKYKWDILVDFPGVVFKLCLMCPQSTHCLLSWCVALTNKRNCTVACQSHVPPIGSLKRKLM